MVAYLCYATVGCMVSGVEEEELVEPRGGKEKELLRTEGEGG